MQKAKENFFFHFGNKFEYYDNLTKKKRARMLCRKKLYVLLQKDLLLFCFLHFIVYNIYTYTKRD